MSPPVFVDHLVNSKTVEDVGEVRVVVKTGEGGGVGVGDIFIGRTRNEGPLGDVSDEPGREGVTL